MKEWSEITHDDLKELYFNQGMSDSDIARKYNVSKSKVTYKRKKYGISYLNKIYRDFVNGNSEIFQKLNDASRERLINPENINGISKALTHYVFRNGPIEDMHADGKISQSDMKKLNKYMVNRIASILLTISQEEWMKLELLYGFYQMYGTDWDRAEPDMSELELIFNQTMKEVNKNI